MKLSVINRATRRVGEWAPYPVLALGVKVLLGWRGAGHAVAPTALLVVGLGVSALVAQALQAGRSPAPCRAIPAGPMLRSRSP